MLNDRLLFIDLQRGGQWFEGYCNKKSLIKIILFFVLFVTEMILF